MLSMKPRMPWSSFRVPGLFSTTPCPFFWVMPIISNLPFFTRLCTIARAVWLYSDRTLIFWLTTRPVTSCREFRYIACVFLALIRKPLRSITLRSVSPGTHTCDALPSITDRVAIDAGNSFLLVENVRSSAYREYVQPTSDASFTKRMSSTWETRLEITGEHGLPCGREFW